MCKRRYLLTWPHLLSHLQFNNHNPSPFRYNPRILFWLQLLTPRADSTFIQKHISLMIAEIAENYHNEIISDIYHVYMAVGGRTGLEMNAVNKPTLHRYCWNWAPTADTIIFMSDNGT